jgi:hypothetical protein
MGFASLNPSYKALPADGFGQEGRMLMRDHPFCFTRTKLYRAGKLVVCPSVVRENSYWPASTAQVSEITDETCSSSFTLRPARAASIK